MAGTESHGHLRSDTSRLTTANGIEDERLEAER
jgi:hypothetical protein